MARGKGSGKTLGIKKVAYPCQVCDKASGVGTILCSSCGMWVHRACVPMNQQDFDEYTTSAEYFICPRCVSGSPNDKFNFNKCLMRYVFNLRMGVFPLTFFVKSHDVSWLFLIIV